MRVRKHPLSVLSYKAKNKTKQNSEFTELQGRKKKRRRKKDVCVTILTGVHEGEQGPGGRGDGRVVLAGLAGFRVLRHVQPVAQCLVHLPAGGEKVR